MNNFLNRETVTHLFVDWFGVLSASYYWCDQSKIDRRLKRWSDKVFDDPLTLNEWMRGRLSWSALCELEEGMSETYIVSSFTKDMHCYRPDVGLMRILERTFPKAEKILVTDNIPLFDLVLQEYPQISNYFQRMYLSYRAGVLKNDKPGSLLDAILASEGRSDFKNCLLVDDNIENCNQFASKGGRYLLVR